MLRRNAVLIVILALAFVLRLLVIANQDHRLGYTEGGGDTTWYLAHGYALLTGFDSGDLPGFGLAGNPDGYPIVQRDIPTPPLYILFVGFPQIIFPREIAVIFIRIAQAVLSVATVYLAYRLAKLTLEDERAGLVAAGMLAVSPAFIFEAAQITSETLYIFLVTAGLWLYVAANRQYNPPRARYAVLLAMSGVLLGLATLTRAALLLFPLGLALHLFIISPWRVALKRAVLLLVVYSLVVSTWTIHNLVHWNRFVIAGEGFASFLYLGTTDWQGPQQVDENLLDDAGADEITHDNREELFQQATADIIRRDLPGYIRRRVSDLAGAYIQPHGTLLFGGESLRELVLNWLRDDRSPAGLLALAQAESFWPKLALYIVHFVALIGGLIGMWLARRRWRWILPLVGFIVYTSLLHLVLDAIPRYIFPTEVFWIMFAAVALTDRLRGTHHRAGLAAEGESQWA